MDQEHTQLCFSAFTLFKQFVMDVPLPTFTIQLLNGEYLTFQSRVIATLADLFGWSLLVDLNGNYNPIAMYQDIGVYGYPFADQNKTNQFLEKVNKHQDAQIVMDVQETCNFLSQVIYPLMGLSILF